LLKLTILLLVLIWAGSAFLGSRKRLIRDVNQLLQYLIWAVLLFLGISALRQSGLGREPFWIKAPALIVWGVGTFVIVRAARLWMDRNTRNEKGRKR